jgi:hypothetical protein
VEPDSGSVLQHVHFSIDNVPFDYAVPVLTGWQLAYLQSDHHVETIGVWIKGFSYEKAPGAATGTLLYEIESTLHDNPAICPKKRGLASYKVSVLGLNRIGVLPLIQTVSNGPALQLPSPGLTPQPPPTPEPPSDDPPEPPSDDPPEPPPICQRKPWTPGCENF